jgi:hypothetical protein
MECLECLLPPCYLLSYCWSLYHHYPVHRWSFALTVGAIYFLLGFDFDFEVHQSLELGGWGHSEGLVGSGSGAHSAGQNQAGQIRCCTIRAH